MGTYELTVIIDGKATPAKQNALKSKLGKLVETFKGKVKKTDNWGKKDLVYKIRKIETGVYLFFELELESSTVGQLNAKLSQEADLLRYLLIKKEE